ncbi:MAG TPA: hypothetical protein VEY51_16590, partial [Chondromyces sp.]|nr:hypothetical protein [Chondromyces sp.]
FLLIFSVEIVPLIFLFAGPRKFREKELLLRMTVSQKDFITETIEKIQQEKINIEKIRIKDLRKEESHQLELRITVDFRRHTTDIYYFVSELPSVKNVEIEGF